MASGFLLCKLARPSTVVRPSTLYFCKSIIKRYTRSSGGENQGHGEKVRAPSTADEFRRVAEEKTKAEQEAEREAEQGIASQTYEKTYDGGEEAAVKHGDDDSGKERQAR